MPYRPKRPCAYPGCLNLTDGKYRDEHRKLVGRQYDRSCRWQWDRKGQNKGSMKAVGA